VYHASYLPDLVRKVCRRLIRRPYDLYAVNRLHRSVEALVLGRRFHVDPHVFHPTFFHSTGIFIDYLLHLPLAGKRLLDMGTGSGAIGIVTAAAGATVVACDINPHAVALARHNAELNNVKLDIRESNLFSNLGAEKFDYICFNIPFYPKSATTPLEMALNAGENFETVRRFAEHAHSYIIAGGRVVIIFSEDSGYQRIIEIFTEAGWSISSSVTRQKNFERFHIVEFS
jgi:release factor glutamine methyltransferase